MLATSPRVGILPNRVREMDIAELASAAGRDRAWITQGGNPPCPQRHLACRGGWEQLP